MAKHTPGPLFTEAVSDSVRVCVLLEGFNGKKHKVILATLKPKQLPEEETHANARLFAAGPDLLDACRAARQQLYPHQGATAKGIVAQLDEAIKKAGAE